MSLALRALFSRRTSEPSVITVDFDGEVYLVQLRRNRLARRYTLRIHSATREVVLTLPPRGSLKQAREFAQRHGAWIAARLNRLPQPVPFADGTVLPVRGVEHRIAHRPHARGTVWLEAGSTEARIICVAGAAPHIPRRVRDYLKREAKRELEIASRRAALALGVSLKRVSIRDQTSRWGSCSTTGVLSYSWRLILAPPFVLDYLAAHEAAHLVERNHSRAFWRQVERVCPDFKKAKAWLDANGADLHRYGMS
ncbi:MAG: SprT family zinc-dependent metalloprotease [Pseudolabrys sp.]|nr:SprT family zinc-dependent metalloprotease [Pseudolabrys sp.]